MEDYIKGGTVMNNRKNNAKLNWGVFVCGFWVRLASIAGAIERYALTKGCIRVKKNLEMLETFYPDEFYNGIGELLK